MLEKPDFPNERIIACLKQAYGLPIAKLTFLPLGADLNTAVYRAVTGDGTHYFVKLRRGDFAEASVAIPTTLTNSIQRETFSPQWRDRVKLFLERAANDTFADPIAAELAAFLKSTREETLKIVKRTEQLAQMLQAQPQEFILCHADIHAWNLLIDHSGKLYIVDWDTLIFAPKERDLMFMGSGLMGSGHTRQEEEALFYQGYGQSQIDPIGIAYYRYERIIEDIAVDSEYIFSSDSDGKDRKQSLKNLKSNFLPNNSIEIARQSDKYTK